MPFSRVYCSTSGTGKGAPPLVQKRRLLKSADCPIGGLGQHLVHGGHGGKDGHLLALDQVQHLRRIKLAGQDGRVAKDDLRRQVGEQPAGMEQGEDIEIDVVVVQVVDDGVEHVPGDHAVADLRPFGQAGGAAGEEEAGDIFFDQRLRR